MYEITVAGIVFKTVFNTTHVLSDQRNMRYCRVNNKISLCSLTESDPIVIVDFSPVTGSLSNATTVTGSPFGFNGNYVGFYDSEWSPDGKNILFSSDRDGRFAIYEIDL